MSSWSSSWSGLRSSIIDHYAHLNYNASINNNMVPPVPDGPRSAKPATETNVPERFELFILGDGEKKVTEEIDTRKCHPSVSSRYPERDQWP